MKLQPELLLVEPIPLIPLRILLFLFSVSSGGGEGQGWHGERAAPEMR